MAGKECGTIGEIRHNEELSCLEKIDEAQSVVESGIDRDGVSSVSILLEECANEAPGAALTLFDLTLNFSDTTVLPVEFDTSALAALGSADVSIIEVYVEKCFNEYESRELLYRCLFIPYLYRDIPGHLTDHFEDWYHGNLEFFEYTVKETIGAIFQFHDSGENANLVDHLPRVLDILVQLAESEGVSVDATLKAERGRADEVQEKLRQSRLILEDLVAYSHLIDFDKVEENIGEFPHLGAFITSKESWLTQLESTGDHPLSRMLTQSDEDYRSRRDLEYLDHCCEVLDPQEQGTGSTRENLLSRGNFGNAAVEIEVVNALRREFECSQVVLEEEIGGKVPDAKVTSGRSVTWVEATKPERSTSALLERLFGVSRGEDSDVRSTVTGKLNSQIQDIKNASPGDLTALVVKNDFSKIDDELVQEYVESRYSRQDRISDSLDLLINYGHNGLSEEPYLAGQVFRLGDVNAQVSERFANAFNATEFTAKDD